MKRINYIDYVKSIAIFSIVLSHFLPNDNYFRIVLYCFNVPVFLFISGISFNFNKSFKEFFVKLLKRVVVPYAIFYVISYIVSYFVGYYGSFLELFYYNGIIHLFNAVLWYFPVFIVSNLLFFIFNKYFNKYINTIIYIILIFIIIFGFYNNYLFYFGINKILLFLVYLYSGFYLKDVFNKINNLNNYKYYIISLLLFIVVCLLLGFINYNNEITISYSDINNSIIYLIFSSFSSILLIIGSMIFRYNKIIDIISKNTLFIMNSHLFIRLPFFRKGYSNLFMVLISIICFILLFLIIILFKKIKNNKINNIVSYIGIK